MKGPAENFLGKAACFSVLGYASAMDGRRPEAMTSFARQALPLRGAGRIA